MKVVVIRGEDGDDSVFQADTQGQIRAILLTMIDDSDQGRFQIVERPSFTKESIDTLPKELRYDAKRVWRDYEYYNSLTERFEHAKSQVRAAPTIDDIFDVAKELFDSAILRSLLDVQDLVEVVDLHAKNLAQQTEDESGVASKKERVEFLK